MFFSEKNSAKITSSIDNFDFGMCSNFTSSHEIYIRATDVNRTIISAMSNMIGFYDMVGTATAGIDYPDISAWPTGFIPIAIHNTVPYDIDFIGNPDADCRLQRDVWSKVKESELFKNVTQKNAKLLSELSTNAGFNVTLENLWIISDDLYIQNVTFGTDGWPTWMNVSLYEQIYALNEVVQDWQNGIGLGLTVNGQNASTLIMQCRGGSLVWSLLHHMQQKIACQDVTDPFNRECRWINPLYYYVYSAHDTTLAALLTALGGKRHLIQNAYPHYSAASTFELIEENKKYFVRATYWHPEHNYDPTVFTSDIHGCQNVTKDGKCPLDTIVASMLVVLPPNGLSIDQYCNLGLDQFTKKDVAMSTGSLFSALLFALASYFFSTGTGTN